MTCTVIIINDIDESDTLESDTRQVSKTNRII